MISPVGKRIQILRTTLNLSREEFAEKVNLTPMHVEQIESGWLELTSRKAVTISKNFGVNVDWLRFGDGQMFGKGSNAQAVGERIKKSRQRSCNMSQAELAQRVGISRSEISYYERGVLKPTKEVLAKIAEVLGVKEDYLLGVEKEPQNRTVNQVATLREALGLSQEEFGARIGYSANMISRIENGESVVTRLFRDCIYEEFGVNPNWFETGEGEMFLRFAARVKSGEWS